MRNADEAPYICKLLSEIDYVIIGFEGNQYNLVGIKVVDDFDTNQRGDYLLVHKSEREKVIDAFTN